MNAVVVLNRNYEYWSEVPVKKVLKWLCQDKIEIVAVDETAEVGSVTFKIKMPLVVRLLNFVGFKPKSTQIPYSQEAVFNRDSNTCGYWHYDDNGKRFKYKCTAADRTLDHLIPVSRGGKNTFTNTTTCCRWHNEKVKRNRTPQEAGLELIRQPVVPTRDKNSFVIMRFAFNPNKPAHKKFLELMGYQ